MTNHFYPWRRPKLAPHRFDPDPDIFGVCKCQLPKQNRIHDERIVAAYERDQEYYHEEWARRLGEQY